MAALGTAACNGGELATGATTSDAGGGAGSPAGQGGTAGTPSTGGSEGAGAGGAAAHAGASGQAGTQGVGGSPGPAVDPTKFISPVGDDAAAGRQVFRFETFGNEGFWTVVLGLPQGFHETNLTVAGALALGIDFDVDAIPATIKAALQKDLAAAGAKPDVTKLASFTDPATFEALLEANAVVGLTARNVTTLNGTLDIDANDVFARESLGMACAFCHSSTDGSTFALAGGGAIGKRVDGAPNHNLQFGKTIALGLRSRAYYPTLALDLVANNHSSVNRKGPGGPNNPLISATPTEAEVDAYLNDPVLYPVGMFDDSPDGNGAPLHNQPTFRTDLAAPWGSEGSIHMLQDFNNFVYSVLMDPTDLIGSVPPKVGGRSDPNGVPYTGAQLLELDRVGPAGLEIIANYDNIIRNDLKIQPYDSLTNRNGFPYVGRTDKDPTEVATGLAAGVRPEPSPIGIHVSETKLENMTLYLNQQHPPSGDKSDPAAIAAGREVFRQQCTGCHNDDQSKALPAALVPFNARVDLYNNTSKRPDLFPAWDGALVETRPGPPAGGLVPKRNFTGTFDDKLIVTEASNKGQPRGDALPVLFNLANKPAFLHDDSVRAADPAASLELLLDPQRGTTAPHPFFLQDTTQRKNVVAFLRSLDDKPLVGGENGGAGGASGAGGTSGAGGADGTGGAGGADGMAGAGGASGAGGTSAGGGRGGGASGAAGAGGASAAINDAVIAATLAAANVGEIAEANDALALSSDPNVRAFAQMMVSAHTMAATQLAAIEASEAITEVPGVDAMALARGVASDRGEWAGVPSPQFDFPYADAQVNNHTAVLNLILNELLPAVQNAKLKAFVITTRANVLSHLLMAETLESQIPTGVKASAGAGGAAGASAGGAAGSAADGVAGASAGAGGANAGAGGGL